MWVHFKCLCDRYIVCNGHYQCHKCGRRMVVSFQRVLPAEKCGHAFRFVPDDDGPYEIQHQHSGKRIRGKWLPMPPVEHYMSDLGIVAQKPHDRRRKPETVSNGPVIIRRWA